MAFLLLLEKAKFFSLEIPYLVFQQIEPYYFWVVYLFFAKKQALYPQIIEGIFN